MTGNAKIPIGILGCTGMVGQNFIKLLEFHPNFEIKSIGASIKSANRKYGEIMNWKLNTEPPLRIKGLMVQECKPSNFEGCKIIFSGLDSSVAGTIEWEFLEANFIVFSNAKNHRQGSCIPLVVPTVNPEHLLIANEQRKIYNIEKGFLATNANCSTTGLVVVLKALSRLSPLKMLIVTTMQAISGAGYPGCSALDLIDNVVPYIGDEEDKLEKEPLKILGKYSNHISDYEEYPDLSISASCNRVNVSDGHLLDISLLFETKPDINEIINALELYQPDEIEVLKKCHSMPSKCIVVKTELDRPQPRLDRDLGNGYSVSVGQIRECNVFHYKMIILIHNTVLGAAGSAILNAEYALLKGLIH